MNLKMNSFSNLIEFCDRNNFHQFDGWELVYMATERNNIQLIKELVRIGADVNEPNKHGQVAMQIALERKNYDLFESLLQLGANVNSQYNDGHFAFHVECHAGNLSAVNQFISHGVDVNIISSHGRNALTESVFNRSLETFERLIQAGADVNSIFPDGNNVMHYACSQGNAKALQRLFELNCVHVNTRNLNGETPLHKLCDRRSSSLLCLNILLQNGADVNCIDNYGTTPYSICMRKNFIKFARRLKAPI
jgi:ankyrin repeat protein